MKHTANEDIGIEAPTLADVPIGTPDATIMIKYNRCNTVRLNACAPSYEMKR